jgi:hypothetical protein
MSDTFDSDSSPEIWVPALTPEASPLDFGFEQDEFLNRSQDLVQIDQQHRLSPVDMVSMYTNENDQQLTLSPVDMVSMYTIVAEPRRGQEAASVHGSGTDPVPTHTELSPLSDSLSLVAPSPRLPISYVPPFQSPSSIATSQSPGIAPSPRLPIDQVHL